MDESSLTTTLAVVRAIHFASCLLIAGVWMFDRLVINGQVAHWRRAAVGILLIATPLALLSAAGWFVLVAASMSELSLSAVIHDRPVLKLVWLHTQFGRAWQIHLMFCIAGMWALFGCGKWIGLICGAGLLGSLAWAGHGSTGPAPVWHCSIDVLHLLASSLWPAGLVPLAILLPRLIRADGLEHTNEVAKLIRRFSMCSLIAVGLLTLTGLFNSWCLLGSFGALVTTNYGRVLLVKLILFAGMIGIGALNLLVLKPRLTQGDCSARLIWRNVMIEIGLGTAVIAAVGLLGLLEPMRNV